MIMTTSDINELDLPTLETARLSIRPLRMDDLTAVHAVLDSGPERWSLADRLDWLAWSALAPGQLARLYQPPFGERAVVLRGTGQLIGLAGYVPLLMPFGQLSWFQQRGLGGAGFTAEVGLFYILQPELRRQGYTSEAAAALVEYAFAHLHLRRILATTSADNLASQGVMRRLGMTLEKNPLPEPPWLQVVGILEAPEL
jgi:RimJ/RimL family protein N-acetyltransferase